MTNIAETTVPVAEFEFVGFRVGDALLGADVRQVEEINRCVDVTRVPDACSRVRGVINLRGEVMTVLDLRQVLCLPPVERTDQTRIVVMRSRGERIGLQVDKAVDVFKAHTDEIEPPHRPMLAGWKDGSFRGFSNWNQNSWSSSTSTRC